MNALINFETCPKSGEFYAGNAGRKVGIKWREANWLLKFPASTGRLQGSLPSYTTAPLSEYLGSHVYGMLGIPVHETVLGVRDGKTVCACKDFSTGGKRLIEFHDLKNSLSDDEPGFTESASTGSGVVLADVRAALRRIPELAAIDGVQERFWDMFVTDAFIRNIDRNNSNWGVLYDGQGHYELAPVYDNGNSFNNKRTESDIREHSLDDDLIRQDALDVRSCYMTDSGKPIAPLKYIASGHDLDCNKALERFMERYEPSRFVELIDSIPEQSLGLTVLPEGFRDYHKRVMSYRYEQVLMPAWKQISKQQPSGDAFKRDITAKAKEQFAPLQDAYDDMLRGEQAPLPKPDMQQNTPDTTDDPEPSMGL